MTIKNTSVSEKLIAVLKSWGCGGAGAATGMALRGGGGDTGRGLRDRATEI
ncbi:MAG TPA: hypothetical protein V6D02_08785 [Candidatus Obscuribacterales bacterium]